jgi:hypothetical protein
MHLLSNCSRFMQQPVGGLWISVGPRHCRIEGVGLSSMPREFSQHSNYCKPLPSFDLRGFPLYPQMRRRRRFIYIRLQRNSLPVVAEQTTRNVVFVPGPQCRISSRSRLDSRRTSCRPGRTNLATQKPQRPKCRGEVPSCPEILHRERRW